MTPDDLRELTEQELGYLGWTFEQRDTLFRYWYMNLNGVTIHFELDKSACIGIANRIARAQGITPPAFSVGQRVTVVDDAWPAGVCGLIVNMWVSYGDWWYDMQFDQSQDCEGEDITNYHFVDRELERRAR